MDTREIHDLLHTLGIGRQYLGHGIAVQAIQLILSDENRLLCAKSGIYTPIAAQRQCDWRTVERNLRTVIRRAWTLNRPLLEQMALYPLAREPTVAEFLDILAVYLSRAAG